MAVRIKFDNVHNPICPTIVLATKKGRRIGKIPAKNIVFRDSMNDGSDVSFKVYQSDCPQLWNLITDFKCIWVRDWNRWFEIEVEVDDSGCMSKSVNATSLGKAELSQIVLYNKEINTEDDIARDDYVPTIFYNAKDQKSSLLDRLIEKAPHYHIRHVDSSLVNIQRTFSFDNKTIHDAFEEVSKEIECLITVECYTDSSGELQRQISAYDLKPHCLECGARGNFVDACEKCGSTNLSHGYGKDTSVFVSTENLADNIKYSVDTGSVKNCFRLEAGDDLMTATVASCNPNGTRYIWYISDKVKEDMSPGLVEKINEYDKLYAHYQSDYTITVPPELLSAYNSLVKKYSTSGQGYKQIGDAIVGYPALMERYFDVIDFAIYLKSKMMPSPEIKETTAANQILKITDILLNPVSVKNLSTCSASTAESAVLGIAKAVTDNRYKIRISDSTYSNGTWAGVIQITNYSDEKDTATSPRISCRVNDDYEGYVKQKILKTVNKSSDEAYGITELLSLTDEKFASEIKRYCLSRLNAFRDVCQSCVDILIEHGIADPDKWVYDIKDLYNGLYLPYYNKLLLVEQEIKVRERELFTVSGEYGKDGDLINAGMQTFLISERDKIQSDLNFEEYLGKDHLKEFASYRREDTYRNSNYISDGLNNAELFQMALNFTKIAKNDIAKSATLQHSISAKLKNLLVMKEFEPLINCFEIGNWVRIKTDGIVYKLRLIEYEINFDNLEDFSVEFSDLVVANSSVSDVESVINQASSMASSYDYVARQAKQGDKGNTQLSNWVDRGLSLTQVKIVDSADNQNISWDSHGLLCKEYLPITDAYDDKQLKLINRGLYLTDDGWKTSKAGIGDFTYWSPKTQKVEQAYGVIADTLVGNLVLSEDVGVYAKDKSIVLNDNGLVITTTTDTLDDSERRNNLFLIQKQLRTPAGDTYNSPIMYVNDGGELVLNGSIRIDSNNSSIKSLDDLADDSRLDGKIDSTISKRLIPVTGSIEDKFNASKAYADSILNGYKSEVEKYMTFDSVNGLVLGGKNSPFKTQIDNEGVYFKQNDTVISYITNLQLHIPNAVIENTLTLGKFFFAPRGDGGVSLVWKE